VAVILLTKRLWRAYIHQNRVKAGRQAAENRLRRKREALIVEHMPRAAEIARQVWHRFNRGCKVTEDGYSSRQNGYGDRIALEDMVSCAYVGLVEAAGRWDPTKGNFAQYSYLRVRGAIVDAHRRQYYLETLHESIDEWLDAPERDARGPTGHGTEDHRYIGKIARYLKDTRPAIDQTVAQNELGQLTAGAIDRILPDDERAVIRLALAGASVAAIAADLGQTPAWTRAKLMAARDRVAAQVQRKAA
jgi:RNA polymerase sigma factor (sigma-70 family)